jgi:predicted glycogen debranching enzyme
MNTHFSYSPKPGSKLLRFAGDILTLSVHVDESFAGKAFVRNNINQSTVRMADIIAEVEKGKPNLDRGWHDVEMPRLSPTLFEIKIPLLKIGHFGYKPYLQIAEELVWPESVDSEVNVEPPAYRTNNTVYCAFVRQFGENKYKRSAGTDHATIESLDQQGYTVIPPSGKFRDLIKELKHIINDLGCSIIHLLPVNPTPTVYARMGRFGSPYAALDFTAVNPELAEFDLEATPLQQFLELVDEVHKQEARVFIDIAINHTGWAAKLHETHPEWIKRNEDNTIHQPGAWGTVWEDLTELDHSNKELWIYLADVFLTWCERGVDGFRCDAGYMIPEPAWVYITAKVRENYPDTIFLLEGLGGPWATTESLLNTGNLNWAYSELFQNYDKEQITQYLDYSAGVSASQGLMIHYAETHDNLRLAEKSTTWASMRTALSALLSHNGAFGFTNGVEWFADEKIFVHRNSALNWGSADNQVKEISSLNALLKGHPAFHDQSSFSVISNSSEHTLTAIRIDRDGKNPLLVVINLNCEDEVKSRLSLENLPEALKDVSYDFLTGEYQGIQRPNHSLELSLRPGQVLCLGQEFDLEKGASYKRRKLNELVIMKILNHCGQDCVSLDLAAEVELMLKNPQAWLSQRDIFSTSWNFPEDLSRHVLYSPYTVLLMSAPNPFEVNLFSRQLFSFAADDGKHYAMFNPVADQGKSTYEDFNFTFFKEKTKTYTATILRLTASDTAFTGSIPDKETPRTALDTNGRGGMMHTALNWPEFNARYDCLLGANLSDEFPENRHIMWRRLRLYCSYKATSLPLDSSTLESSKAIDGRCVLTFHIPVGLGHSVRVRLSAAMLDDKNATLVTLHRLPARSPQCLPDHEEISLVIRPDIEDRNFHMETKAHGNLEEIWNKCISPEEKSFTFSPDTGRILKMTSEAPFVSKSEWSYNNKMRLEAERGLQSESDLFSPGYFNACLQGDSQIKVLGQVLTSNDKEISLESATLPAVSEETLFEPLLRKAMKHYIVKRGELKTVIAGYPWFLDWGRDTLICVRGIISAGFTEDVRKILLQFGGFEEKGTLPNMIHGGDASNRDTTDAPLWYFVACDDLCKEEKSFDFLNENAGDRSIKEILISLAENIISGTTNGIYMDSDTGLVYSPSHFTWMDTNYPAGTPREGYPVEIQALWYKALSLLSAVTQDPKWSILKEKVRENFIALFWNKERGYLSDCLHSNRGSASAAEADDALRSNQLFAITLGLVDGEIAEAVLSSSEQLLIPGGIRSLADKAVDYPLPVYRNSHVINDQHNPYWGKYEGDEDTRRKPAYHNGTAWSWPFPSYSEALFKLYGERARKHAIAILNSSRVLFDTGCLNQIPEVLDGSAPHRQRGCDAQAWGVTEAYRVWRMLKN